MYSVITISRARVTVASVGVLAIALDVVSWTYHIISVHCVPSYRPTITAAAVFNTQNISGFND